MTQSFATVLTFFAIIPFVEGSLFGVNAGVAERIIAALPALVMAYVVGIVVALALGKYMGRSVSRRIASAEKRP